MITLFDTENQPCLAHFGSCFDTDLSFYILWRGQYIPFNQESKMKVHSKEEWLALVQNLQASGLTKSEFCRRNQIANGRFYEMVKQFGGGVIPVISAVPTKNKPNKEFEKKVKSEPTPSNFIEIEVENKTSESSLTVLKSLRIITSYGSIVEIQL